MLNKSSSSRAEQDGETSGQPIKALGEAQVILLVVIRVGK